MKSEAMSRALGISSSMNGDPLSVSEQSKRLADGRWGTVGEEGREGIRDKTATAPDEGLYGAVRRRGVPQGLGICCELREVLWSIPSLQNAIVLLLLCVQVMCLPRTVPVPDRYEA